jgi:hypothetical protein
MHLETSGKRLERHDNNGKDGKRFVLNMNQ